MVFSCAFSAETTNTCANIEKDSVNVSESSVLNFYSISNLSRISIALHMPLSAIQTPSISRITPITRANYAIHKASSKTWPTTKALPSDYRAWNSDDRQFTVAL